MSYHSIQEIVPHCIAVPFEPSTNPNIDQLGTNLYSNQINTIKGWKFTNKEQPVKPKSELTGYKITKKNITILLVLCAEDDYAYLVGKKENLTKLKNDWNIKEPILKNHQLDSIS